MGDEARATDGVDLRQSGERQRRLSRRGLLETGLGVGLVTGLVWGVGSELAVSDGAGTITYALARPAPDRGTLEPRRKEVPPVWHESLRLAFGARERLREATIDPLVGATVLPGTYDDPEAAISVTATTEEILGRIEELLPSIPVSVDVVDEAFLEHESDFELTEAYQLQRFDADDIPGGVICEGDAVYGTLSPALFDADSGERYFATSNHVFGDGGAVETAHSDMDLALLYRDEPHHVGEVVRGYPAADIVQVAPVEGYRPAPTIARARSASVVGQYTRFGLADLAARDDPLTKLGAVSDRTTGQIHGVDGITCYTGRICKTGQLTWGSRETLVDGDSGSVAFHQDPEHPDDYALVAGVNNARTRWLGDFTWGTAAHHLLSEYGLHF